ncbi:hypothetical protein HXX76_015080 [Chlamydomonas incerta]|uniref:2'-5'-oligoadenylate synthetase 1 domain-containing protein n=1 Tax=Chlamydomonas incerta TaxID=51695 RepID=A0A835SN39_CHLIN|nr:hypothetical protein HXX76_015080 [Chlamydomonas incerta]|eukprot:KAG2423690.1 hypothetical protein HXX76_015080 [Chlamydomonas incerta]
MAKELSKDPSFFKTLAEIVDHLNNPLKRMHLDLAPSGDKAWVRHFNGQLRPLTAQALSAGAGEHGPSKKAIGAVHALLTRCPHIINVDRFHNGGSFGRRTMTGQAGEALQVEMMRELAKWLRATGWAALEVEYGTHYKNCINMTVDGVDVDIKLAANLASGSQANDRGKVQRNALMKQVLGGGGGGGVAARQQQAEPVREAALSEALTAVVKGTSDRIKSVARLVKCWYKYSLKEQIPHVPSVLLEVLTLAAAQRAGLWDPAKINRTAEVVVFLAALDLLDAAVSRHEMVVLEAGPVWGYTRKQALACRHVWEADAVVVLHPIDPTCNLARAQPGREVDWPEVARRARELRRVVTKGSMWELLNSSSLQPAIQALR